jgi:hypothetical protein
VARVVQALLEMDRRLRSNPFGLGELKNQLHYLDLHIHIGFVRPLMVEFGIHKVKRLVFVKRIEVVTAMES